MLIHLPKSIRKESNLFSQGCNLCCFSKRVRKVPRDGIKPPLQVYKTRVLSLNYPGLSPHRGIEPLSFLIDSKAPIQQAHAEYFKLIQERGIRDSNSCPLDGSQKRYPYANSANLTILCPEAGDKMNIHQRFFSI